MKRILTALVCAGAVVAISACGSSDDGSGSETTAAATEQPTTTNLKTDIQLGQSYDDICNAMLPYFDTLESWGQNRDDAAKNVLEAQQQMPEWANLSPEQQADTQRAIENAGKGQC